MTWEQLIQECLKFEGSFIDYPYGDFVTVIKTAAGKSFALIGVANGKDVVSIKKNCDPDTPVEIGDITVILKCSPDLTEVFRRRYKAVVPGYYTNKNHWNTVIAGKDVSDEDIVKMIALSFELVSGKKK
jgi:predicted DNA-binding protein (MmcQ/YjbR family)